jgi:hypothetical protein
MATGSQILPLVYDELRRLVHEDRQRKTQEIASPERAAARLLVTLPYLLLLVIPGIPPPLRGWEWYILLTHAA